MVKKKSPCANRITECRKRRARAKKSGQSEVARGRGRERRQLSAHPVTRAAHESEPRTHMLDIPMDSAALWWPRNDVGPVVFPPFAPSPHGDELSSFLARSSLSLSKHHGTSPLRSAGHEHGVRRHAHVPNSHSLLARGRGRKRE